MSDQHLEMLVKCGQVGQSWPKLANIGLMLAQVATDQALAGGTFEDTRRASVRHLVAVLKLSPRTGVHKATGVVMVAICGTLARP